MKIKNILKHELNTYLMGRSMEHDKELPLYLNEDQGYIQYQREPLPCTP